MMNSHSVVGTTGEVVSIMIQCIVTISVCIRGILGQALWCQIH